MGFSSFICPLSGLSIANMYVEGLPKWCSQITVFHPDGSTESGTYEGYCNIYREGQLPTDSERFMDENWRVKVVLTRFHTSETWEDLPYSEWCPEQGYFLSRETREKYFAIDHPPQQEK